MATWIVCLEIDMPSKVSVMEHRKKSNGLRVRRIINMNVEVPCDKEAASHVGRCARVKRCVSSSTVAPPSGEKRR